MKTSAKCIAFFLLCMASVLSLHAAESFSIRILNASGQQVATGNINGEGEVTLSNLPAGKFSVVITNTTTGKQCRIENSCFELNVEAKASVGNGTTTTDESTQGKSSTTSKNNARREMVECSVTGVIDWSNRSPQFRTVSLSGLSKGTEYFSFSVKVKGGNGCTIVRKVTVF